MACQRTQWQGDSLQQAQCASTYFDSLTSVVLIFQARRVLKVFRLVRCYRDHYNREQDSTFTSVITSKAASKVLMVAQLLKALFIILDSIELVSTVGVIREEFQIVLWYSKLAWFMQALIKLVVYSHIIVELLVEEAKILAELQKMKDRQEQEEER